MTRPCSRIMDEPVRFLGLDDEELGVGTIIGLMLHLYGWSFRGLIAGIATSLLLRTIKHGQPAGMVLQRLWSLGLPLGRGWPPAPSLHGTRYSPW